MSSDVESSVDFEHSDVPVLAVVDEILSVRFNPPIWWRFQISPIKVGGKN